MADNAATALVAGAQRLRVTQVKEWGEILTGFETKNKYAVRDQNDQPIFLAAEDGAGFLSLLLRMWLKALRPFTMQVLDAQGKPALSLKRPFRFIFHRLEISGADGRLLGVVEKKWSWVRRIYQVRDAADREILQLFGPILKPWTFKIMRGDQEVGKIQKKWVGLGKEIFTDADNFGVEFSPAVTPAERLLLVAAVFLIDFVHFENHQN